MSKENPVDSAAATSAIDDEAASSATDAEEQNLNAEGQEPKVEEEDPNVIQTRNTQKRFDKLTQTINSQAQQIEQLQQRPEVEFDDPGMPKADDFEDDMDFAAAKGAYLGEKAAITRINQSNQAQAQETQRRSLAQTENSYLAKIPGVQKSTPDFQTVVHSSMLLGKDAMGNYTPATMAILEADNGPEVAYHIATNPDIALSLNNASPTQAAMTVARLSIELSAKPANINDNPDPIGSEGSGAGLAAADDGLKHIDGAKFE